MSPRQIAQGRGREEIYEALHPEVKYDSGERMKAVRHGEIISSCHPSFAADTAAKTGVTERTVQQEVQIAANIAEPVKEAIRNTPLAVTFLDSRNAV
jgi:ParB family chromosome partitioning protein